MIAYQATALVAVKLVLPTVPVTSTSSGSGSSDSSEEPQANTARRGSARRWRASIAVRLPPFALPATPIVGRSPVRRPEHCRGMDRSVTAAPLDILQESSKDSLLRT